MAASRIIADEIRASKQRKSPFQEEEQEQEEEGEDEGIQDIHDLNNPFHILAAGDEEEEEEDN